MLESLQSDDDLNRRPPDVTPWIPCRQHNFTMELEGATTEEAIAEERAAAFHAAENKRLQVPAGPLQPL